MSSTVPPSTAIASNESDFIKDSASTPPLPSRGGNGGLGAGWEPTDHAVLFTGCMVEKKPYSTICAESGGSSPTI